MTIQEPVNPPPTWASSPPGNTIVTPTLAEQQAGFQPGSQAQVEDFVIANVLNNHTYNATINGVPANFTSPNSGNTQASIAIGLAAAINGIGQPVTATATSTAARVTANVAGQAFVPTTTDATNVTLNEITPNRSGKPIRQYVNWFFNGVWQWLIFWFYTIFQWSDVSNLPMHVPSAGTPPTTTSGTLVSAGGTAVAYIPDPSGVNRRAVGLAEAHTYGPSATTLVYLHYDGSWSYGGSLPANAILVWEVVTDPTQITSVVDLRSNRVRIGRPVSWDINDLVAVNPSSDLLDTNDPQTPRIYTLQGPQKYSETFLSRGVSGQSDLRIYTTNFNGIAIANGCYWHDGMSKWFFAAGEYSNPTAYASVYVTDDRGSFLTFQKSVASATSATSWTDTVGSGGWDDEATEMFGRVTNLGAGLVDTLAHALLARIGTVRASGGISARTLLLEDPTSPGLRVYISNQGASGGFTMTACIEIVRNAAWDGTHWVQDTAGLTSKTEYGREGRRELYFTSGSATTLSDVIDNATNWNLGSFLDASTGRGEHDAWVVTGMYACDGAGGFTLQVGTGATYGFNGFAVRVTLARPMPSVNYSVEAHTQNNGYPLVQDNFIVIPIVVDASHFDLHVEAASNASSMNQSTTAFGSLRVAFTAKPVI